MIRVYSAGELIRCDIQRFECRTSLFIRYSCCRGRSCRFGLPCCDGSGCRLLSILLIQSFNLIEEKVKIVKGLATDA